jgi:hypothetical protein
MDHRLSGKVACKHFGRTVAVVESLRLLFILFACNNNISLKFILKCKCLCRGCDVYQTADSAVKGIACGAEGPEDVNDNCQP